MILSADTESDSQQLLQVIEYMLRELRGTTAPSVSLDAHLDRDLGIDSLARAELLLRIDSAFGVQLRDESALNAETPRALLAVIAQAARVAKPARRDTVEPVATGEEEVGQPDECATLVEALAWHVARHPTRPHIRLLVDDSADTIDYAALARDAGRVAAGLRAHGLVPGGPVAIMLPTSRAFFTVFFGVLYGGGVPVPIYPPFQRTHIEEHLRRQGRIVENSGTTMLVADEQTGGVARLLRGVAPSLRHVLTTETLLRHDPVPPIQRATNDLALLQYTSGSTGHPKGVTLSYANLLANIRAMGQAIQVRPQDVFVSWLPLYHDMGLIGAWLGTLYYGVPLVVMPPQSFLARPSRWLWALHRYRGTLSAGPNFSYELLASKLGERDLEGLDLACWRVAFNGAEPIRAATVERFCKRFAAYGFRREAMYPVYGLAECAVGLTFPPLGRGPQSDWIDRARLAREGRAVPTAPSSDAVQVVSCGMPLPGYEVRVVDEAGREVPERMEGRIEFRGPSAARGYFNDASATAALVHDTWLDTGDVGYVAQGELHLTSRAKDLIIRGGHNVHPYDLEEAIGELEGVRRGRIAVFGAADPGTGTERIVALVETRVRDAAAQKTLRSRIADLAVAHLGVPVDDVVVTTSRVVPKTSSGKIRRSACREWYERGALVGRQRPVWWQFTRLTSRALQRLVQQLLRTGGELLYAAYVWTLFGVIASIGTLLCLALPGTHLRRRLAKGLARVSLTLTFTDVTVEGARRLDAVHPAVYVANHASYIDAIVLIAILPAHVTFTAKREFKKQPYMDRMFRQLGVRYVGGSEAEQAIEGTDTLTAALKRGEAVVIFPEGGFSRRPGLAPFHVGAFLIAAKTGVPIVPVVLRGTRSILRSDSWLPRHHAVHVVLHSPKQPHGADWQAALALRDETRAAMLASCGEPDLSMA